MKKKQENIEELTLPFWDEAQGLRIVREIEQVEALLADLPVAMPSVQAVEAVKQKVRDRLARRQRNRMYARLFIGAAACAGLAALAGLLYFNSIKTPASLPVAGNNINSLSVIWSESDPAMMALAQEIETIADEMETSRLQRGYTDSTHSRLTSVVEEMELVATNLDFWKG